jgi:surface carbohydrate biosynthesis protein
MRAVILPSENQVREFDAKLLLACVLAERGLRVFVGARHEIHNRIASFPPSVYVAKDFRKQSERILAIVSRLGHGIVAWDEEGFVQPVPELYYSRRFSPVAASFVDTFFAWGEIDARLLSRAPLAVTDRIKVTGNPRLDLLRPELRRFHESAVAAIRQRFPRFVLFNSNFGSLNPQVKASRLDVGPMADVARRFWEQRQAAFNAFQEVLPRLAKAIAPVQLVIRPHPAERHALWADLVKDAGNAHVIHEGASLLWILAAAVTFHSGCTTGIEAFLLGKSPIALVPAGVAEDAITLPDVLSERVVDASQLVALIQQRLAGQTPPAPHNGQLAAIGEAAAALFGPLAADRIADIILDLTEQKHSPNRRLRAVWQARVRQLEKHLTGLVPGHKTATAANLHRFPGLTLAEVQSRVAQLQDALDRFAGVAAAQRAPNVFEVSSGATMGQR